MFAPTQLAAVCLWALAETCAAQSAALSGVLGGKALLVVDDAPPKSVAVGETYRGVKVISVQSSEATVEIDGKRQALVLGAAPVSQGGTGNDGDSAGKIVLQASGNGHFFALGQINGSSVRFMVDTGASFVAISAAEASRLGINLKTAQPMMMGTANGSSVGWLVKLSSVRINGITVHEVDAVVMSAPMPYALLGNSFLTRFQMTRTNDQMVLERRF